MIRFSRYHGSLVSHYTIVYVYILHMIVYITNCIANDKTLTSVHFIPTPIGNWLRRILIENSKLIKT